VWQLVTEPTDAAREVSQHRRLEDRATPGPLFIANLAFQGSALESAKFGILVASLLSGVAGMMGLMLVMRKRLIA
jgi:Na+/H+ antiporter 1